MIKTQILEAIKHMPNVERLEIIEFAWQLLREEMNKVEKLSVRDGAEMMLSYYEAGSNLTEFVDSCHEDF